MTAEGNYAIQITQDERQIILNALLETGNRDRAILAQIEHEHADQKILEYFRKSIEANRALYYKIQETPPIKEP